MIIRFDLTLIGHNADALINWLESAVVFIPNGRKPKMIQRLRDDLDRMVRHTPQELKKNWHVIVTPFDGIRDEAMLRRIKNIDNEANSLPLPWWVTALLMRKKTQDELGFGTVVAPTGEKTCLVLAAECKLLEIPMRNLRNFVLRQPGTIGLGCNNTDFRKPPKAT